MFVGIAVAIVFVICARLAQSWRSLTAQQAVMAVFLITAFALKQWGAAELGNHRQRRIIKAGLPDYTTVRLHSSLGGLAPVEIAPPLRPGAKGHGS